MANVIKVAYVLIKDKHKPILVPVSNIKDQISGTEIFKLYQPTHANDFNDKKPYALKKCDINCDFHKDDVRNCIRTNCVINILHLGGKLLSFSLFYKLN